MSQETLSPPPLPAPHQDVLDSMLKYDVTRLRFASMTRFREYAALAIVKALRIKLSVVPDFPAVTTLAPYQSSREQLPADPRWSLDALIADLVPLGFHVVDYHLFHFALASTRLLTITLVHESGQIVARSCVEMMAIKKTPNIFVHFFSQSSDGQVVLSTPRQFDPMTPEGWHIRLSPKAPTAQLLQSHRAAVSELMRTKPPVTFPNPQAVSDFMELLQQQFARTQQVAGILKPLSTTERADVLRLYESRGQAAAASTEHADVLAEVARLQSRSSHWGTTLTVLIFSLIAFLAFGFGRENMDLPVLATIVAILFIHEAGHYLAMQACGYRNLKMFFIPFLGAAVSGRAYNVPDWKKTIVSLMGPLPGIVLAVPIGMLGVVAGMPKVTYFALMMMILNAINLLPFLPLDGGWVLHHVLFARNVYLETIFRILAVIALLGVSVLLKDGPLRYVGIAMAIQLPMMLRQAAVARALTKDGFRPISHDSQSIPPEAAIPIISRLKSNAGKIMSNRNAAEQTIQIFDRLNSQPPRWAASIGLLFVHGCALFGALIFSVFLVIGAQGVDGYKRFGSAMARMATMRQANQLQHAVSPATVSILRSVPDGSVPPITIVSTFADHSSAASAASALLPKLGDGDGCIVFGDSLLISLANDDSALRDSLYQSLSTSAKDTSVGNPNSYYSLSLTIQADPKLPSLVELGDFAISPQPTRLIAPWDPTDTRSAQDKAATRRLGHSYSRIFNIQAIDFDQDRQKPADPLHAKLEDARKRNDRQALKDLQQQLADQNSAAFRRKLDALSADPAIDKDMLHAALQALDDKGMFAFYAEFPKTALPLFNPLPDGTPNPYGIRHGMIAPIQLQTSAYLNLISPIHAAPALVHWLAANTNGEIHYELGVTSGDADFGFPPATQP